LSEDSLALLLHWAGAIAWLGSAICAAWLGTYGLQEDDTAELRLTAPTASSLYRLMTTLTVPGMALAGLGGLWRLYPHFWSHYAREGWMHAKLGILLVLAGLTAALIFRLQAIANQQAHAPVPRAIFPLLILGTLSILTLAAFRPGA